VPLEKICQEPRPGGEFPAGRPGPAPATAAQSWITYYRIEQDTMWMERSAQPRAERMDGHDA
jgi:hypothetical protein